MPAYEVVYYYLWREKRLSGNVDPLQNNLKDPLGRERLARTRHCGIAQLSIRKPLTPSNGGITWACMD